MEESKVNFIVLKELISYLHALLNKSMLTIFLCSCLQIITGFFLGILQLADGRKNSGRK